MGKVSISETDLGLLLKLDWEFVETKIKSIRETRQEMKDDAIELRDRCNTIIKRIDEYEGIKTRRKQAE